MRHALRILFLIIAVGVLCLLPSSAAPLQHRASPPQIAATPQVPNLTRRLSAESQIPVTEPDDPLFAEDETPGDIFGLMYHNLSEDHAECGPWTTTPQLLRENLQTLATMGYLPLSIEDYIAGSYRRGQDYYILTFDDGYLSNLTLAKPILSEMGVPATVFVITGSTEMNHHMSWQQLRELTADGNITVYSHTHTHANAQSVSFEEFMADEATAQNQLTEQLGTGKYTILSYPNGAYTKKTMTALAAEGYDLFVIQNRPYWYEEGNADGIRILTRWNVAVDADMETLVNLNRKNHGLNNIADTLAERRAAYMDALRRAHDARLAWAQRQDRDRPITLTQ